MAYIYQIQNDINGKIYVGKTEFSIEKRFQEHCRDCRKETKEKRPLYAAMRKYGIEHFHISLLEETDNPEEKEVEWIEKLGSFKNGYNATTGGDGRKYLDYDLIISSYEKIKNCIKVAELLNIHPDSVRKVLKNNNVQIIPNTEISKENLSIPVVQIDKNTDQPIKIYPSAIAAEKELNIQRHINSVCKGSRKTAGGFKWKYLSDLAD